jgi:hypothetical protein
MNKLFRVQLARLVRQTADVIVQADKQGVVEDCLREIYDEFDGDDAWEDDETWGCEPGEHAVLGEEEAETSGFQVLRPDIVIKEKEGEFTVEAYRVPDPPNPMDLAFWVSNVSGPVFDEILFMATVRKHVAEYGYRANQGSTGSTGSTR